MIIPAKSPKLGLGTVQFGLPYGISNKTGVPSVEEIKSILASASKFGIDTLDTAAGYGTSEEVLGQVLKNESQFAIVTKTAKTTEAAELKATFSRSLDRLKKDTVHGLLVHDPMMLFDKAAPQLIDAMSQLKSEGKVKKIGVSVYSPEQAFAILESFSYDIIQLPMNLLDQRALQSGLLKELKKRKIEIHVRSAFLQGLLLMPLEEVPKSFDSVLSHLHSIHGQVRAQGLSMLEASLGFILGLDEIDKVIVGVCAESELNQITKAVRDYCIESRDKLDYGAFSWPDERILNPALWPRIAK